jgi:hypothetical protein
VRIRRHIQIHGFVVLCIFAFLCSPSRSMEADSRCIRAADHLGCTCALQFGGFVTAEGDWWGPITTGRPIRGFQVCMEEADKAGSGRFSSSGGRNLSGFKTPDRMYGR